MEGKLDCPCGCGLKLRKDVYVLCVALEEFLKKNYDRNYVLVINSGARCKTYNLKIGGAKNSTHPLGMAVDVKISNNRERWLVIKFLYLNNIKRWGWYSKKNEKGEKVMFIHFDIASEKDMMPTGEGYYPVEVAFDYA